LLVDVKGFPILGVFLRVDPRLFSPRGVLFFQDRSAFDIFLREFLLHPSLIPFARFFFPLAAIPSSTSLFPFRRSGYFTIPQWCCFSLERCIQISLVLIPVVWIAVYSDSTIFFFRVRRLPTERRRPFSSFRRRFLPPYIFSDRRVFTMRVFLEAVQTRSSSLSHPSGIFFSLGGRTSSFHEDLGRFLFAEDFFFDLVSFPFGAIF